MRRPILGLALLAVPALVAVGCGGGSSNSTTNSQATTQKTAPAQANAATVTAKKTSLGTILVDSTGRTLYLFEKDKGDKSTCSGACASAWPPLTTSATPKPGTGTAAAKLGTSTRSDGTKEVTYNGHPLYTYAGDAAPGDTTGEGLDQFGAEWYVLSPQGKKVEKEGS